MISTSSLRTAALLACALVLGACATPNEPTSEGLDPFGFHMSARVAVRYGEEAASGRVVWRHTQRTDDLVISNPVGQGIAELIRRDEQYVLRTQDGQRHDAKDPESLTENVLGWRLPLQGLPYWVRGEAMPGVPAETRKEYDRLAELKQSGWTIQYLAYDERGLPTRLNLSRAEDLQIRLAVENWALGK